MLDFIISFHRGAGIMTDEGSQEKNQDIDAQEPKLELPVDQL